MIAHTLHFLDRLDVSQWLLIQALATKAANGRVYGHGEVFTAEGQLVATFTKTPWPKPPPPPSTPLARCNNPHPPSPSLVLLGRSEYLALRASGSADSTVEGYERPGEGLGQRDVPGVVAGDVGSEFPHAVGKGLANGYVSRSSRSRSRWAAVASSCERMPLDSCRRKMLVASTRACSGAAKGPIEIASIAHGPSCSESTRAATSTEASTTTLTFGQRRGPGGSLRSGRQSLPLLFGVGLRRARSEAWAETQAAPVHLASIPAWTGG